MEDTSITKKKNSNNNDDSKQFKINERNQKMMYIIFISLLFDLLAFTIILPLFPSILEYYSKSDSSGLYSFLEKIINRFELIVGAPERYTPVLFGGFLGSMFSFLQFIASPIAGGLSDYYGRKPIMLVCAIGISLSYLLWALSGNFLIFVMARFTGGISKGNISLCMSVITDVSSSQTRGRGMALIGVAFSLGFILGPMIGAIFAVFSSKANDAFFVSPPLIAFGLSVCQLFIITFWFKETLPVDSREKKITSALSYAIQLISVSSILKFTAIKRAPRTDVQILQKIGWIYFIYLFLYSGLEFTVTFLMFHKFGFTSMNQAKMFLTTGIIMTLIQGTVVRRLPEKSIKQYAVFSLYLISPAFILVGVANSIPLLYIGMILFAISTAFTVTCLTTMVSKYGKNNQKGSVLGTFRSIGALARALGPIVGSIAFWSIGSKQSYVLGGLLLLYPAFALKRLNL